MAKFTLTTKTDNAFWGSNHPVTQGEWDNVVGDAALIINRDRLGKESGAIDDAFDEESVAQYACFNKKTAKAVKKFKPNDFGLYDMSGNTAEMCGDLSMPYDTSVSDNLTVWTAEKYAAEKSKTEKYRAYNRETRGGSQDNGALVIHHPLRSYCKQLSFYYYIGFRVVCNAR